MGSRSCTRSIKVDPEQYMAGAPLEAHRQQHSDMCSKQLMEAHLRNFLWNIRIVKDYAGILGFENTFKGMPMVVAGAGPSLDKHWDLLKQYRKNIIIIVCDAALPAFMAHDLPPDIVIVVDPTEKQKENFNTIDCSKTYSVLPPICHPEVFRRVEPRHCSVYNIKDPSSMVLEMAPYHTGRKGALPAGVLTTGSGFGFAAMSGASPIMFIGMDLSWPSPDRVYADKIAEEKYDFQRAVKLKGGCALFPDINGGFRLTHNTFICFWAWLKTSVEVCKVNTINCSEEGILKSKYIKVKPFKDTLEKYASKELVGIKEKIEKAHDARYEDKLVEKLLVPPFRKGYAKQLKAGC